MISEIETPRVRSFVTSVWPWLLGAGMFVVFLLTLNYWVTPFSLGRFADLAGWSDGPHAFGPVTFLVTYPLRWLPVHLLPLAMNLFTAVCAALSLVLLARCVALLPHDRTYDQRQREQSEFSILTTGTAWAPPLFAALVCGLQLTFWENAIETTGEMFDLLIFAYVIRCLLEYRISERDAWFVKFAFVYGLGMANNWAMVGFFPGFLGALIWIKGLSAFSPRFMFRTFGLGLAGFSLFFLLPLMNIFHQTSPQHFWEIVRSTLSTDRRMFTQFPRDVFLVLSLSSLLPVFIISIRWASYFGDNSPLGIFLATATFHIVHAVFFVICLWVALDGPISPRTMGFGLPFLTFSYLGSLSLGYFSGYFLLIFGGAISKSRQSLHPLLKFINFCVTVCTWLLLIGAPLILLGKNLPQLQTKKMVARGFQNYFSRIAQSLPPGGAVVLSDDPFRTFFLKATLNRQGKDSTYLLINTGPLSDDPAYLPLIARKNPAYQLPASWANTPAGTPTSIGSIQLLDHLAEHHEIYYIHPSFGFFFEHFYPEPHGLVYQLKVYPTNVWDVPVPDAALINENQEFWKNTFSDLSSWMTTIIRPPPPPANPDLWKKFLKQLNLKQEPNTTAQALGGFYSRPLDFWGVELQRANLWTEASKSFDQATELNPVNSAALINKAFNADIRAGKRQYIRPPKNLEEKLGAWVDVLNADGPLDEPNCRDDLANTFARGGNYRQAVQELDRVREVATNDLLAPLQLAQLMLYIQVYSNSLTAFLPYTSGYATSLSNCDHVLKMLPEEPRAVTERTTALFLKSVALIQLKDYEQAIGPLNELLLLQTNYAAQLNRAIAFYKLDNLDAAKRDYKAVGQVVTNAYQVFYGLGEIAYKQNDTRAAIKNYHLYLKSAPPNTEEAKFISARLKELETKTAP